jgi:succinate dehydrogenase hydrophobic anchor subunit
MNSIHEKSSLKDKVEDYIELRKDLFILNSSKKASKILANLAVRLSFVIFGILAVMFSAVGVSGILNDYFQNSYAGYFIVSGFFLILSILIFLRGKNLFLNYIGETLLNIFYDEYD